MTNEPHDPCHNPPLTPVDVEPYDVESVDSQQITINACDQIEFFESRVVPPYDPTPPFPDGGGSPPPVGNEKPWMRGLLHLLSSAGEGDFWSTFDTQTATTITYPWIDGFRGRSTWATIQPDSALVYDWSGIDGVITKCKNAGKKLTLSIGTGTDTPQWVYDAGIVPFPWDSDGNGSNDGVIPFSPDPLYLSLWMEFIAAFGAKYDDEDTVASIFYGGMGQFALEYHITKTTANTNEWDALAVNAGYSAVGIVPARSMALRDATAQIMDAFKTAFPRTSLLFTEGNPWGGGAVGKADETYAENYSLSTPNCGWSNSFLHAETTHTNIPLQVHYPHGFQPISASSDEDRFYLDPQPDPFPSPPQPVYDLTQAGIEKGAQYLEIYAYDLIDGNPGGINNQTFISQREKLLGNFPGPILDIPVNITLPVISGTLMVGSTLSTTNGTWTNNPTSYKYQWIRYRGASPHPITGATSSTYVIRAANAGRTLGVTVTAKNAGGSASATSLPTDVILATNNLCVGPAATGNGSGIDWNNLKSWDSVPKRGEYWYLVDGTYPAKTFSLATAGTSLVTIRKATVADHGGITVGWNNTLGDGQAIFSGVLAFTTSYWTLDGVTGGGPTNWDGGLGFVTNGVTVAGSNVTFMHAECLGAFAVNVSSGDTVAMSYLYPHDLTGSMFTFAGTNITVEYSNLGTYGSSGGGDKCLADVTGTSGHEGFRFNIINDIQSLGGFMWDNAGAHSAQYRIYGNVFVQNSAWSATNGVIGGRVGGGGEDTYNMFINGNTFINVDVPIFSTNITRSGSNVVQNNLYYNCLSPDYTEFTSHDYNHYINSGGIHGETNGSSEALGDPFIDYAGGDYHLNASTDDGVTLAAPYDTDMFGVARGSVGTWDRGAIEYTADGAKPYVKGIWGAFGNQGTIDPVLAANAGIVGVGVSRNWSEIEQAPGDFHWQALEDDINECLAAGFEHINLIVTHSTNDLPEWLLNNIIAGGEYITLRDPGQNHPTYCDPTPTPLYWGDIFHQARLNLIAKVGEHFAHLPYIHSAYASFANHNSMDWNVQDTQGTLEGCPGEGDVFVDQAKQWNDAGWTRAKMRQVGMDVCDAVAAAFPNQVIKLPIGGLNDELARFTRPATVTIGEPIVTCPSANFTSADLHKRIIGYTTPAGSSGTKSIPNDTYIGTVLNSTRVIMSSSPTDQINVLATISGDRISLPDRDPDTNPDSLVGTPGYSTLAYEIYSYVQTRPYRGRFYIQRNTVDVGWQDPGPGGQDWLPPGGDPPGTGAENYIKFMVANAAPWSGLQDVSRAHLMATDHPPFRQNDSDDCDPPVSVDACELQCIVASMNVGLLYNVRFFEIWPQDSAWALFYDAIEDATLAMGGKLRTII